MDWSQRLIIGLLGATLCSVAARAQSDAEKVLLEKAHSLDSRGRLDLAAQNWQQVLLSDPKNTEALAGVARAYKAAGQPAQAQEYLDRLRAASPSDPRIQQIETMSSQKSQNAELQHAGQLAQSRQYAAAMTIYRHAYGDHPPPGDMALAYFETEAALPESRPHAIAGLREYARKAPSDSRYEVTLGKVLTFDPKTRAEGIALLKKYPTDGTAEEALHQALSWDAGNPNATGTIRAFLKTHPDAELQSQVQETEARQKTTTSGLARTADERAAFSALQANHLEDAQRRFNEIHDRQPENSSALAGLGFVSMKQNNFAAAVDYLESARANGARDKSVEAALATSRFWLCMTEAGSALTAGQVDVSLEKYRKALQMRPASSDALRGLAGTLLRSEQYAEAAQIYVRLTHAEPASPDNWRGLVMAESLAGDPQAALETVGRLPSQVRNALATDPQYLAILANTYSDAGDEAARQRVLTQAMALPFPQNGNAMKPSEQMAFAELLLQSKRYDQAAGLYRQILEQDAGNLAAFEALVRAQHAMGKDALALTTVEEMPPEVLALAERAPGFLGTIAAVYQSQGKLDIAQMFMEEALALSTSTNQAAPVSMQLALAGIYVIRGNAERAYPMYQRILSANPGRTEAWAGLFNALHDAKRDTEALAELREIPATVMTQLNREPKFLEALASIYNGAGDPATALRIMRRAAAAYQQKGGVAPADFSIAYCYLLLNAGDDLSLYTQLMALGSRQDLAEAQRTSIQAVWAAWSVRRAATASKSGNFHRALQILDAANHAFPENLDVQKALAGGYMQAGQAKRAEAVYLQMDWTDAKVADYRAALGAALQAKDLKQAALWLDVALRDYADDPQILQRAAQYEQARGHTKKAAEYYQQSLTAMGPADPAVALIADVKLPLTNAVNGRSQTNPSQELIRTLTQGMQLGMELGLIRGDAAAETPSQTPSDYLPGQPPVPVMVGGELASEPAQPPPSPRTKPAHRALPSPQGTPQNVQRLGDYAPPQGRLTPGDLCALNRMAGIACSGSDADPTGWTMKPVAWITSRAANSTTDPQMLLEAEAAQPLPLPSVALTSYLQEAAPLRPPPTLRDEVQDQMQALQGGYSPWIGGTALVSYRSGQPGFDHFVVFSEPLEASAVLNDSVRASIIVKPVLLDAGTATGQSTLLQGTNGAGCGSNATCTIYTQTASGIGGELQLRGNNYGVSVGYSPYGFLTSTAIGSVYANPGGGPWTFTFNRDSVVDTQLSYSGLVNTGSTFHNAIWGGAVANAFEGQYARTSDHAGFYIQGGGQYITGQHVETNSRADGDAGAYWRAASWADNGTLTVGMNMFAMHYEHNLRYFTYGQGGYFSPDAYLLANVPIRFDGHQGTNFHYRINGSLGVQAFQEDAAPYYPVDPSYQQLSGSLYPTRNSISGNYLIDAEGAYRIADHWYAGGLLNANNSRGYNSVVLGFYVRYMFRSQFPTEEGPPTGIFPVNGLRPMQVP